VSQKIMNTYPKIKSINFYGFNLVFDFLLWGCGQNQLVDSEV
jgi:hypothetical protein